VKTRCYCIYCPRHPLHEQQGSMKAVSDFQPYKMIFMAEGGADVDCLDPKSDAYESYDIDPSDEEYPYTAYGDENSVTGFTSNGITLYATCGNEGFEVIDSQEGS